MIWLLQSQMMNGQVSALKSLRIADQTIVTDLRHRHLMPFLSPPETPLGSPILVDLNPDNATFAIYDDQGWIGNRWRRVICFRSRDVYRLNIEDVGSFVTFSSGDNVYCVEKQPGVQNDVLVEALIGPPLVLALALHGTWCIHASAVTCRAGLVIFVGESGNGKSTLARFLSTGDSGEFRRISDDTLPVQTLGDRLIGLPRFPQLKLAMDEQPSADIAERIPVSAVYGLAGIDATTHDIRIDPLVQLEASLALIRHTVAARLFDRDLLRNHLAFCSQVVQSVPVRRLSYPRRFDVLPEVRDTILTDLDTLAVSHSLPNNR